MIFRKYEGAKNDFILIDSQSAGSIKIEHLAQMAKILCQRQSSIGADGLIYLSLESNLWSWIFYNSDGSRASMCGNAARCVAHWLHSKNPEKPDWSTSWQGESGKILARKSGKNFEVSWLVNGTPIKLTKAPKILETLKKEIPDLEWAFINAGVPHLVLNTKLIWPQDLRKQYSSELAHHPSFGREGTNVSWLQSSNFQTVTFERGVEDETLACGSGAIACFMAKKHFGALESQMFFNFPGGKLCISMDEQKRLWLRGPSHFVYEGEINGIEIDE